MSKCALKISLCAILLAALSVAPSAAQQTASIAKVSKVGPAATERCPGALVDVTAASEDERSLACSAADQALELLGRCEISLRRPLRVQIGDEHRHPLRWPVLGFFETKHERVLVARYESMPSLAKGTPFALLSQRDLFKSIVLHEIVHGVLHQHAGRHVMSHAAGEYLAYALQIESLPPSGRDSFLQAIEPRVSTADLIFTDVLWSLDPFFFAAHAYDHFKDSDNGCTHLRALLEGQVAFISTPLY